MLLLVLAAALLPASAAGGGCATDAGCAFSQRCCGVSARAENCPAFKPAPIREIIP